VLFVALSCLQGRPMGRAYAELAALPVDGVQLTPGCQPTPGFAPTGVVRTHHGYSPRAFRTRDVWADDGACLVASDSVHPPRADAPAAAHFLEKPTPILETMYPSYALGDGDALERAMALHIALAVDVSHLHMQREQGVISTATLARVLDYDRIAEVHVSANDGRRDLHAPLTAETFGLAWARERLADLPVVLECYFHKLDRDQRLAQLDLIREGVTCRNRSTLAS
jgi:hypothetical protein